ncbi:MAG TPA: DUF6229 family protein [Rhizomicrobium sp.]|nr:DUF6229 family protein [Rhizomicrobium sp.]
MSEYQAAASWRDNAEAESPAGPLFMHAPFAEADIACAAEPSTLGGHPISVCSGSFTIGCC